MHQEDQLAFRLVILPPVMAMQAKLFQSNDLVNRPPHTSALSAYIASSMFSVCAVEKRHPLHLTPSSGNFVKSP
jgi:hypothetical protein